MGNITGFKQTVKGLGQERSSYKLNLFLPLPGFAAFSSLNMVLASIHCQELDQPRGGGRFRQLCIDPQCYSREIMEFA